MDRNDVAPPPNCGKRLLQHIVDERSRSDHTRPFASIPRSKNPADGYTDVTYALFANAVNRLAQWIIHNVGRPSKECESLAYLAPGDLRYQIVVFAAVKAGFIMFLVSPRNSAEAFASLLHQSGATKLLTDEKPSPAVSVIKQSSEVKEFAIPSLEALLDPTPVPVVPLDVSWEEYRFRPFIQIHSSGSTGTPKLVTLKHGSFSGLDAFQLLDTNEVFHRVGNMRLCVNFPLFHVAGLIYAIGFPIFVDSTVILPPAVPLTAEVVDAIHVQSGAEYTMLIPSLVTDLAKNEGYLSNLSKLEGVTFSGGPLSEKTGELIAERTKLIAGYGASEWMTVPQLLKDPEDWAYFRFNEKQSGMEFRERDNGLFEMVLVRDPEYELNQPVFVTFPDIDEFGSKDLFSRHPTKPGLWKYVSRWDDIIVFSNGEKLNPVTLENMVTNSPHVNGCVVIGQGRFQAALLVEPKDRTANKAELLEKIWPAVTKANVPTVKHGRIARDLVIFTKPDKPLPRAGKGTIQRASANKLYEHEVDELYASLEATTPKIVRKPVRKVVSTVSLPSRAPSVMRRERGIDLSTVEATKSSLTKVISEELDLGRVEEDDDFFALGMDSLQLINLVRAINTARPHAPVEAKQVYDHPSINKLAQSLHSEEDDIRYGDGYDSDDEELKQSWFAMDEMYGQLTSQLTPDKKRDSKRRHLNGWLRATDFGPVVQPDGGQVAWLQVLAMFLVNLNNWGLVNSFGIFQEYYQTHFLSGNSASAISWIGTLQGSLLLIVGVVSGPLFDTGYFKSTLLVASLGLVFALMMLSLSTEYYQVMLTQGVLLGVCEGLLYIPSIALVPVYFKHRRGLALGLSTGGGAIGGVLYPVIFYRLLETVGFGWAVRVIGFIALITLGVAIVLSKPLGPRSARQLLDLGAFQDPSYLTFLTSAFFLLAGVFVPYFLATSYTVQHLQTSSPLSFYMVPIINAAQFAGRVLPAWSSDSYHTMLGAEVYMFLAEFVIGIMGFSWAAVSTLGGYITWLVFYGFFSGFVITLPAVVLPHICPNLAVYGTRIGMLYACAGVGFLISTPIATVANARTHSFQGSQLWTGATCLAASLFFLYTAIEARQRRLLYEMGKRRRHAKAKGTKWIRLEFGEQSVSLSWGK